MMSVEIRILASILARVAGRSIEDRFSAHNADISGMQYGILRTLAHQSYTLSELSRRFVVDPSTLVPVIDALERKGLVTPVEIQRIAAASRFLSQKAAQRSYRICRLFTRMTCCSKYWTAWAKINAASL